MNEMIKMVAVLAILAGVSGGLLASVRNGTAEQIEIQQLQFVKGPAIQQILSAASNDPITDRFKLPDNDAERSFFVGVIDGEAKAVCFETSGKGFGGDIGVMVGVNINDGKLVGVGITTHSETPGLGSKCKDDPSFARQFIGMQLAGGNFAVDKDGGEVDAYSGATVTSRGVVEAVNAAVEVYDRLHPQIESKMQEFN